MNKEKTGEQLEETIERLRKELEKKELDGDIDGVTVSKELAERLISISKESQPILYEYAKVEAKPIYYTMDEVAEILQVTTRSIYTYIKSGDLAAIKLGRVWRITPQAIKDFMNGKEQKGEA